MIRRGFFVYLQLILSELSGDVTLSKVYCSKRRCQIAGRNAPDIVDSQM